MTVSESTVETLQAVNDLAGKYLTFELAKEQYGLEILKVREIIGIMSITSVPQTPEFVKGVINLRGKVIPVVDLRLKFGLEEIDQTEETCIIVVNVGNIEMGVVVDKVSEVLDIDGEEIEAAPEFGADVETGFILGMGKAGGQVTILLDIDQVLSGMDVSELVSSDEEEDVK